MRRAGWLWLSCVSCSLPFVAQTPRPLSSVGTGGLEVVVSREVHVDDDELELELTVRNGAKASASVESRRLGLDVGPMGVFEPECESSDDEPLLQLGPGESTSFRVCFPLPTRPPIVLQFRDAVRLGNRSWPMPDLEVVRVDEVLERPRASALNLGVRLLGGALVSETLPGPLTPTRLAPSAFMDPLDVYVGVWFRWLELNLVARAGAGRLVAVEVGVRPGLECLTLSAGYGLDLVEVPSGFRQSGGAPFGHGPRVGLDVAFDSGQFALGAERPRRFGVFVASGASALTTASNATQWHPFFEGGLRWRWR